MLFYIMVVLTLLSLIFMFISFSEGGAGFFGFFLFVFGLPIGLVWHSHADDLATISTQGELVAVYERRRASLNESLSSFDFPKSGALMNSDSPVASIVRNLSDVEEALAKAELSVVKAKRAITSRKLGWMAGVVDVVGDYEEVTE